MAPAHDMAPGGSRIDTVWAGFDDNTRRALGGSHDDTFCPRGSSDRLADTFRRGGGGTSDAGARADTAPGSGAESSLGSVLTEGFSVPTGQPGPQSRPHTRLQTSIHKPKLYTDGTVHYGCLAESDEPRSLDDALTNKNWKIAMDVEYDALMKNKTC
jgi:hypothetical protein